MRNLESTHDNAVRRLRRETSGLFWSQRMLYDRSPTMPLEEGAYPMKLKSFILAIGLPTIAIGSYSLHSQLTPKPLRSFVVTSIMSSPRYGSPYLETQTQAHAVRSDGSWVLITYVPNVGMKDGHLRDIYHITLGIHTTVDDLTESIQTRAMSPRDIRTKRFSSSASCKGLRSGEILGFSVDYSEEKTAITGNPAGDATSVVKEWQAPDLGCFVLRKETTWIRNSDGFLLVDTKIQPIAVTFQSVDQFFDVPATYTERTPGETLRELSRLYPDHFPQPGNTDGIDENYRIAHDQLPAH